MSLRCIRHQLTNISSLSALVNNVNSGKYLTYTTQQRNCSTDQQRQMEFSVSLSSPSPPPPKFITQNLPKIEKFMDDYVQVLLSRLTEFDVNRVFRFRKQGQKKSNPSYQFLTDTQLKKLTEDAVENAREKILQMPPVMDIRQPIDKVLDEDRELIGFDGCNYVFTDISVGVHDRARVIVVRQPDGILRLADWHERDRCNQMYFPNTESPRHLKHPVMFEKENLTQLMNNALSEHKRLLKNSSESINSQSKAEYEKLARDALQKFEYILDRNCQEFEPDHDKYVKTCFAVFNFINENHIFSCLSSTRHFGPLAFHLSHNLQDVNNLILYYLNSNKISLASDCVRLFAVLSNKNLFKKICKIEKSENSSDEATQFNIEDVAVIKEYVSQNDKRHPQEVVKDDGVKITTGGKNDDAARQKIGVVLNARIETLIKIKNDVLDVKKQHV